MATKDKMSTYDTIKEYAVPAASVTAAAGGAVAAQRAERGATKKLGRAPKGSTKPNKMLSSALNTAKSTVTKLEQEIADLTKQHKNVNRKSSLTPEQKDAMRHKISNKIIEASAKLSNAASVQDKVEKVTMRNVKRNAADYSEQIKSLRELATDLQKGTGNEGYVKDLNKRIASLENAQRMAIDNVAKHNAEVDANAQARAKAANTPGTATAEEKATTANEAREKGPIKPDNSDGTKRPTAADDYKNSEYHRTNVRADNAKKAAIAQELKSPVTAKRTKVPKKALAALAVGGVGNVIAQNYMENEGDNLHESAQSRYDDPQNWYDPIAGLKEDAQGYLWDAASYAPGVGTAVGAGTLGAKYASDKIKDIYNVSPDSSVVPQKDKMGRGQAFSQFTDDIKQAAGDKVKRTAYNLTHRGTEPEDIARKQKYNEDMDARAKPRFSDPNQDKYDRHNAGLVEEERLKAEKQRSIDERANAKPSTRQQVLRDAVQAKYSRASEALDSAMNDYDNARKAGALDQHEDRLFKQQVESQRAIKDTASSDLRSVNSVSDNDLLDKNGYWRTEYIDQFDDIKSKFNSVDDALLAGREGVKAGANAAKEGMKTGAKVAQEGAAAVGAATGDAAKKADSFTRRHIIDPIAAKFGYSKTPDGDGGVSPEGNKPDKMSKWDNIKDANAHPFRSAYRGAKGGAKLAYKGSNMAAAPVAFGNTYNASRDFKRNLQNDDFAAYDGAAPNTFMQGLRENSFMDQDEIDQRVHERAMIEAMDAFGLPQMAEIPGQVADWAQRDIPAYERVGDMWGVAKDMAQGAWHGVQGIGDAVGDAIDPKRGFGYVDNATDIPGVGTYKGTPPGVEGDNRYDRNSKTSADKLIRNTITPQMLADPQAMAKQYDVDFQGNYGSTPVYRGYDENGNVTFSDTASGAKSFDNRGALDYQARAAQLAQRQAPSTGIGGIDAQVLGNLTPKQYADLQMKMYDNQRQDEQINYDRIQDLRASSADMSKLLQSDKDNDNQAGLDMIRQRLHEGTLNNDDLTQMQRYMNRNLQSGSIQWPAWLGGPKDINTMEHNPREDVAGNWRPDWLIGSPNSAQDERLYDEAEQAIDKRTGRYDQRNANKYYEFKGF